MTAPMTGAGAFSKEPEWTESVFPECDAPYRTVLSACPCPALIVSPEGEILSSNAAFRDLTGYAGEGSPDRNIGAFLDRRSTEFIQNRAVPESGTFTGKCRCGDGTSVPTGITVSPAGPGEMAVFLAPPDGMAFQTSETAFRTPRLEILGLAAAGASHHLNSLLTGILGNISLAALDAGHTVLPHLKQAERSVSVASSFTRKVLDLVRGVRSEPEPLDTAVLVEETAGLIRAIVPRRITVETVKHPPLPPMMADHTDITFALLTLGLNARDAIEDAGKNGSPDREREITIEAAAAPASEPGGHPWVTVTVSDTGGGMSEEVSRRVFEPFFTTKNDGRGTGISLAITQRLVARNRGRCEVASSPGNGSAFTISIPAAPTGTPAVKPEPSGEPSKGCGTILFMDDDDLVRAFAKAILERQGYTVLLAADGSQGLAAYRNAPEEIRIVVIDLTMPVMSGCDVLREIRKINPGVPAIITSGFDQGSIRDQIREFEDVHILLKPFTILALTETVRKALND